MSDPASTVSFSTASPPSPLSSAVIASARRRSHPYQQGQYPPSSSLFSIEQSTAMSSPSQGRSLGFRPSSLASSSSTASPFYSSSAAIASSSILSAAPSSSSSAYRLASPPSSSSSSWSSSAHSSSSSSPSASVVDRLIAFVRAQWFLVGLVLAIALARAAPFIGAKGGPLLPEYTIKYGAVFLIFFNSGLTLKTEELKKAAMQISVHVAVQGFTLALVPFVMTFVTSTLRQFVDWNPAILTGLSVLSCLPPPVSSAVILTSAAGGNEAAAIFNSAFGSFLGIFVTPLLMFSVVGESAGVPVQNIFISLLSTVVLPLILGQIVRHRAWSAIQPLNIPFSNISSVVLLLIIFATFCDTFKAGVDIDTPTLLGLVCFVVLMLLVEMTFLFVVCNRLQFAPRDIVCILFCATHKSLTLGIPMLNILFAGHKALSLLSLPLLICHPTQILLGGIMVPVVRKWLLSTEAPRKHDIMNS
eukprot:m.120623 g.120623  ORF g.120623 m.120623 type:complete len:473 (+) comp15500_c2_seq1:269-1687(+)